MRRLAAPLLPLLVPVLLLLAACARQEEAPEGAASDAAEAPLVVAVTNAPLGYIAERIGGASVAVTAPYPFEGDPAFWEPDETALLAFANADLVLLNGAGFEPWTAWASLPVGRSVDTSAGYADRLIADEEAVVHVHGPEGAHGHGATAFTTWLDGDLARRQARAVRDALARRRPGDAAGFDARLELLDGELGHLHARIGAEFARLGGAPLLASHPVYQYLARHHRLDLRSVHWEPGVMPAPEEWAAFDALRAEHPASIMLWEGPPAPEAAAALAERGVRVLLFDPAGGGDPVGWMTRLRDNLERLDALADPDQPGG